MQLSELRGRVSYVLTLEPGVVRYLAIEDFLLSNEDEVIAHLQKLGGNLEIKSPEEVIRVFFLNKSSFSILPEKIKKLRNDNPFVLNRFFLDLAEYDNFFSNESWEQRLRMHHKLGGLFLTEAVPSSVYYCFHEILKLETHAIEACLKSWIKEAWENHDVTNFYRKSNEHFVVKHTVRDYELEYVFQRTPFVKSRLDFLTNNETEIIAAVDLDQLRRSKFDCYIYLMEDLRNKTFKIGKSKTPGKRERTLQSEVPQIVMRFSIPAEEACEKELHERFDAKRIRGEWFEISKTELAWIVSLLKSKGDTSRAFVDFDWLGRIHFDG